MFTPKSNMRFFILLLTVLFTMACSSPEKEKPVAKTKKPTIEKKKIEKPLKPKRDPFTDENATERLLAYGEKNPETIVEITTTFGAIKIKLFKTTPLHRANFIMMTKLGYFDSTVFSRVVPNFMAQAGSGFNGRHTDIKTEYGAFRIPSEFSKKRFHKRGAVAMARNYRNNPDKMSNPYAFYFVEGSVFSNETLDIYEEQNGYKYTQEQRDYYTKSPGAAHIDGEHTVFGEIIEGYDVIPKLTTVETDGQDWPLEDIFIIKAEVIK